MKILWVHHIDLNTALYSTFPLLLIGSLLKNGHEIHLIVPSIRKNGKIIAELAGNVVYLPTVRLPVLSILSFYLMLLLYLPKTIKKINPHAIVADIYSLPGIIVAQLFPNIKFVIDVRSSFVGEKGIRGYIKKVHYISAVVLAKRLGDCITVTSSALKKELDDVFRVDSAMIKVLTNGVSLDLFDYSKYRIVSKKLKEKLNLNEKFVVFYHGSFGSKRGLLETIEAIVRLAPRYPEIAFFIVGSGSHFENEMESLVKKKALQNNVYIHEAVSHSEVPKFISMCDVAIAPFDSSSYPRTSCPLKILEYLAMMKPIITTAIPFNMELVKHGACLFFIHSNSPEDITRAIEHVYKNIEKLRQVGKIGRTVIEQYYTWEEKAKDLENFIGALSK